MTEYVTKQGDTWDAIAKRLYGDERFLDVLIRANINHRKTVVFRMGSGWQCQRSIRSRRHTSSTFRLGKGETDGTAADKTSVAFFCIENGRDGGSDAGSSFLFLYRQRECRGR